MTSAAVVGYSRNRPPKGATTLATRNKSASARRGAAMPAQRAPQRRSTRNEPPTPPPGGSGNHHAEVEQAVAGMQDAHVQCRDFGHNWLPLTARWDARMNVYVSTLQCQRCDTQRNRSLSRTGEQVDTGYQYADGYLVKGLGRLTGEDRNIVRLMSVLQVLEGKGPRDA